MPGPLLPRLSHQISSPGLLPTSCERSRTATFNCSRLAVDANEDLEEPKRGCGRKASPCLPRLWTRTNLDNLCERAAGLERDSCLSRKIPRSGCLLCYSDRLPFSTASAASTRPSLRRFGRSELAQDLLATSQFTHCIRSSAASSALTVPLLDAPVRFPSLTNGRGSARSEIERIQAPTHRRFASRFARGFRSLRRTLSFSSTPSRSCRTTLLAAHYASRRQERLRSMPRQLVAGGQTRRRKLEGLRRLCELAVCQRATLTCEAEQRESYSESDDREVELRRCDCGRNL